MGWRYSEDSNEKVTFRLLSGNGTVTFDPNEWIKRDHLFLGELFREKEFSRGRIIFGDVGSEVLEVEPGGWCPG